LILCLNSFTFRFEGFLVFQFSFFHLFLIFKVCYLSKCMSLLLFKNLKLMLKLYHCFDFEKINCQALLPHLINLWYCQVLCRWSINYQILIFQTLVLLFLYLYCYFDFLKNLIYYITLIFKRWSWVY